MVVETNEGQREIVEKTIEEYALVVTGQIAPGDVLSNQFAAIELQHQLDLAKIQLKWSEQQNQLLYQHNQILVGLQQTTISHAESINKTLQIGLTNSGEMISAMRRLAKKHQENSTVQISLNRLVDMIEKGLQPHDEKEVIRHVNRIKEYEPSVFREIYDFCRDSTSGAAGSLLANWIGPLFSVLPS